MSQPSCASPVPLTPCGCAGRRRGSLPSCASPVPITPFIHPPQISQTCDVLPAPHTPPRSSPAGILNNDIKWNFSKFLVDKEGKVVGR